MLLPDTSSLFLYVGVAVLVVWRLYARVRKMVGRQRLSLLRLWMTVFFFPLSLIAILIAGFAHPLNDLALAGGVVIGTGLAVLGHRLTRFERTGQGWFYTPNAHLGIALSLLLIARIAYRTVPLLLAGESTAMTPQDFTRSPLTLLIFGTLVGYYVTYAIGLLRWRHAAPPDATASVRLPLD